MKKTSFLYVFRMQKRDLIDYLTLSRKYKVGISKDVDRRKGEIESDIDGEVDLMSKTPFKNVRKIEKHLHDFLSDSNVEIETKGKGKAGETEWFRLTWPQYCVLESKIIYQKQIKPYASAAYQLLIFTTVLIFLICLNLKS